jgi:hypothetical protein
MDIAYFEDKLRAVPYPNHPVRPEIKTTTATPAELRRFANAVEKYNDELADWRKMKMEWQEKQNKIMDEFKTALFEDLGINKNPKAEKLYAIAWAKGHSGGLSEIWNEACDMVDLIK